MGAQEDLAQLAIDNGIAEFITDEDTGEEVRQIWAGREPDGAIDPAITFYGARGEPSEYTQDWENGSLPPITNPRIRVEVRSRRYGQAQSLAEQLHTLLHRKDVAVNGHFYTFLHPMYEPIPLGQDENNRKQVGFTVRAKRRN